MISIGSLDFDFSGAVEKVLGVGSEGVTGGVEVLAAGVVVESADALGVFAGGVFSMDN
ncbi:MAG: hypothetical protein KA035_02080 [Candidatus Levybacteria bacterium]|nr:hypothetical protein [Candidatus Levybacteria bacterium]